MSDESPARNGIWFTFGDAPVDLPGPGDVSDAADGALRGWRRRVVEPVVASLLGAEELEELSVRAGRPDEEVADRLASQLQDWVAESRFGWGQLRVPDYRLG